MLAGGEMGDTSLLVACIGAGAVLAWLVNTATARWGRGRGLLRVPARVKRENQERLWQARSERAQGWRELWRSLLELLVAAILVFLLGFFLGSVTGVWG